MVDGAADSCKTELGSLAINICPDCASTKGDELLLGIDCDFVQSTKVNDEVFGRRRAGTRVASAYHSDVEAIPSGKQELHDNVHVGDQ